MHEIRSPFIVEAMVQMGYDALNLSNWDFVFGATVLRDYLTQWGLATLSANIVRSDTEEPITTPACVIECNGCRVGLVGVVAQKYQKTILEAQSDVPLAVLDETSALQRAVADLLPRADVIIALANVGIDGARELAEAVPGLDVIICGHGQDLLEQPLQVNGVCIVKSGYEGQHLGSLRLQLDERMHLAAATGEVVRLDKRVPEDEEMLALMDRYHDRLRDYKNELLFREPRQPDTGGWYTGAPVCAQCHLSQSGHWRTTKHAIAFATLVTRNQHYNPECITCHITGYGYTGGFSLPDTTPEMGDVQCEMCHGPGGDHTLNPAQPYGEVEEQTCTSDCHTEEHSPKFDYATYVPKIRH